VVHVLLLSSVHRGTSLDTSPELWQQMNDQFKTIPTDKLIDSWVLLRPVVRESVEYIELFESLKAIGFLNSISVRPSLRQPDMYEIIDGMWRVSCVRDIGILEVPCIIKFNVSNDDVLALQIQANAIRPRTKPIEFAQQIRRIQKLRPDITMADLSNIINKSPGWVTKQLGLLRLEPLTQKAVNRGEISLGNAYMLASVPPRLRDTLINEAKLMPPREFKILSAGVIKQFKEAVKQGRMEAFFTADFKVQSFLRSLAETKIELEECMEAPLILAAGGHVSPLDCWKAALEWVLHIDPESKEKQKTAVLEKARKKWVREV